MRDRSKKLLVINTENKSTASAGDSSSSNKATKYYAQQGSMTGVDLDTVLNAIKDKYLSKEKDDESKGIISFLKGVKIVGNLLDRIIKKDDNSSVDDQSVFTSARVMSELGARDGLFLRKDKDDRSTGKIASDKGFEAGTYVKGFLGGSGAWIGADGYGEMSGLTLREFLEVPELRFNRIDVVSGELWNSIAFGLVEKVDEENRLCWIKLEENERCGLHVGDLCRGLFADFGDGSKTEGEDLNNFQRLYGFKTSYFTPKTIIENREGLFCFEYELCPDTNIHPCASMKFAVYGSKTDASRRASAYSTRTYKRYLNGVDDWKIEPNNHIYAQYGDLNGLTIGGVEMKGYGSFQSNAYFRGVQIQLPPEQLEELRGESAYSVVLSSSNDVVVIDANGNMGNAYETYNVVTDGKNVVTDGKNVVTSVFKLQTNVQVKKGSKALYYSTYEAADSYTLSINPVGCEAAVMNGVVIVTKVTDQNNCYVNIQVNCEGKATFNLVYRVSFVKDGKQGEDGKKGNDGVSYRIEPNITTISKTMTGTLSPEAVTFKLQENKGGVIYYYPTVWRLKGRNLPTEEWKDVKSADSVTSFDVLFTDKYKYYELNAKTYGNGDVMLGDTLNISIVADGKEGESVKGDKGVMARYRGEFVFYNESDPYVYNDDYRDIVLYNGNVFQVYKYGDSVTDPPTVPTNSDNDGKWQIANKMRFVAMDTALIDNANIGGFTFARKKYINGAPVGVMRSQYGPICISSVKNTVLSGTRVGMTINDEVTKYVTIHKFTDAVYELAPSTLKLIRRKNENEEYVHETSSVYCSVKTIGTGGKGYTLKYSKDGGAETTVSNGSSVSTSGVTSNITFILYSNSEEVGRQVIPVLDDGSTTMKAVVEKETLCLKVDKNGEIESGLPFRVKAYLYKGANEVSITSLNISTPSGVEAVNELVEIDTESGTFKCLNAVVKGEINATSGVFRNIITPDEQFHVDVDGTTWIGGFRIKNNGLTNINKEEKSNSDAYILFRNTDEDRKVALGGNVLVPSTGVAALGQFESTKSNSLPNYGLLFDIANSSSGNFAFCGKGSGVLSNMMCGYGVQLINGSANTITRIEGSIIKGNKFWVKSQNNTGIGLPPISYVRTALDIAVDDNSTNFSIPITIMNRGSYDIRVWGKNDSVSSMNNSNYPILEGSWWIKAGHTMDVVLGYCNGEYVAFIPVAFN